MSLVLGGLLQAWTAPEGEGVWLLAGTAGMVLGTLYLAGAGWGEDDSRKREFYVVAAFVPVVAAVAYLSMALGYGATTVRFGGEPHTVYWARYAGWLFTTPLLLLVLALLADTDRATLATLLGIDATMVATGAMAALTNRGALGLETGAVRLVWWGVATGCLLALLYVLLGPASRQAARQPGDVVQLFARLRNLTVAIWAAYPVVWILGTNGLGYVGLFPETAAFAVLDLLAKVGFGVVLVRSPGALDLASRSARASPAGD